MSTYLKGIRVILGINLREQEISLHFKENLTKIFRNNGID